MSFEITYYDGKTMFKSKEGHTTLLNAIKELQADMIKTFDYHRSRSARLAPKIAELSEQIELLEKGEL